MDQDLNDLGFWLPAEFLTDDNLLTHVRNSGFTQKRSVDASHGSSGYTFDLNSAQSDEDDLIADLTRKYYCNLLVSEDAREVWKLPSSPQSTLCGCKPPSKIGLNSATRLCSPQDSKDDRRRDLLYAAAEEVARMQMIEETAAFYSTKHCDPLAKPVHLAKSQRSPKFHQNQTRTQINLSYHQLQAARFEQMRRQQMMKNGGSAQERIQGLTMSAWPTVQQSQLQQHQPGSGMTAVFLRETGVKKERLGTGVFMPRRFGPTATETRKKSAGCSSVLLPDKVVHVLNLKLDPIDSRVHGCHTTNTKWDTADLMGYHQMRNAAGQNQELQLPPEWTY